MKQLSEVHQDNPLSDRTTLSTSSRNIPKSAIHQDGLTKQQRKNLKKKERRKRKKQVISEVTQEVILERENKPEEDAA
jgi:hypothetical protein